MKIIINVFLYLYLLVIKPFNLLSKKKQLPVHALACFGLCVVYQDVQHTKISFVFVQNGVVSSHREGSGQVCIFKTNKSIRVPQIL